MPRLRDFIFKWKATIGLIHIIMMDNAHMPKDNFSIEKNNYIIIFGI